MMMMMMMMMINAFILLPYFCCMAFLQNIFERRALSDVQQLRHVFPQQRLVVGHHHPELAINHTAGGINFMFFCFFFFGGGRGGSGFRI